MPNGVSTSSSGSSGSGSRSVVQVYEHNNFNGNSQSFSSGVYKANQGNFNTVGNDKISSLRVSQGFVANVCENESQQGQCSTFKAGEYSYVGDQLNDKISYIEVSAAK